jgi:hypothetical protein
MTAWELLRQVALTRACLVEIVSQKDYPSEWTAPEPEVLASLNDWAEAVSRVSGSYWIERNQLTALF